MKKISFLLAGVALFGTMLTGCKDDTQPRIEKPTEFVLNTPDLGSNVLYLDKNSELTLSWTQPNYGLGTTPTYYVQFSEFEDFLDPTATDEEGNRVPSFMTYNQPFTHAQVELNGQDLALQLQDWKGWASEADIPENTHLYVRIYATIENYPEGDIYSNNIELNFKSYYVVTGPDAIYLIGQPSGWNISNEEMPLWETSTGSKIYEATYFIPAGEFQFRFYDRLGDWNMYSIGAQDEDKPVDIPFIDGKYEGPAFYDPATSGAGKGSWQVEDWAGGNLKMTVNLNNLTVVFEEAAAAPAKKLYIIGACSGWDINNESMALTETSAGSDVYEGTFTFAAGDFQFKIYTQTGSWDAEYAIGSQEEDANVDIVLPYNGPCVQGKGNWNCPSFEGECAISVNLKTMTVDFAPVE